MSNDGVNTGRRRFLIAATSVVGAVGTAGAAIPFLGSWQPSAKAKAAGAPVRVNINKIEAGQQIVVEWRGQPVFVLHRTPEIMAGLEKLEPELADPTSLASEQPSYVDSKHRASRPELLFVLGICTHLGCAPTFRPEVAPEDLGPKWLGGYFCACHGSRYDLAGRVYKAQPAPTNLPVPPHSYETDDVVIIGVDEETA